MTNTNPPTWTMEEVVEALRPFSEMAGELFARNYNKDDIVFAIHDRGWNPHELTFEDFLRARSLLSKIKERTNA